MHLKKNWTVQKEDAREVKRSVEYYNLDMIISVGYRIKSVRGVEFRRWANKILKDYYCARVRSQRKKISCSEQSSRNTVEYHSRCT